MWARDHSRKQEHTVLHRRLPVFQADAYGCLLVQSAFMPDSLPTYFSFEGITLASNGSELTLDYSDPDQGGTKICYRYVVALRFPPRLITWYAHEGSNSEREIGYDQIPADVFRDALDWLRSNAEIARASGKEALCQILDEWLEFLSQLENASEGASAT